MSKVFLKIYLILVLSLIGLFPFSTLQAQEKTADEPLPLDVLKEFTDVFASIKSDYVEDIDDQAVLLYHLFFVLIV